MVIRTAFSLDVLSERCGWVGREFPQGVCTSEGTWVDSLVIVGVFDKIDEVLMRRSGVCVSPDFVPLAP